MFNISHRIEKKNDYIIQTKKNLSINTRNFFFNSIHSRGANPYILVVGGAGVSKYTGGGGANNHSNCYKV
jgi:hypothetical protein